MPPKARHVTDVKPIHLKQAADILMQTRNISTKAALAAEIKVTPYYFSKIINGETPLTEAFMEKFLNFAKVDSVQEILDMRRPPDNIYETISDGLRTYMETHRVTQAELARDLKTDQQILSRILHGKKKLYSPDMLIAILQLIRYKL